MNNREEYTAVLNELTKDQLADIAVILETAKKAIGEIADVVFCEFMHKKYEADPAKGEAISFEEAARQLGVELQ